MTLALLHTLRDLAIGLFGAGSIAFLFWLEIRSERKSAQRVEDEDLQDFRKFHVAQTRDWEWPTRPAAARSEYVAKPKERAR